MAGWGPRLTVRYVPTALRHLDAIWEYNARTYGSDHADHYVAFLRANTDRLAVNATDSRPVPTHPNYRYIVIRRAVWGHGHVAVYVVIEGAVQVLAFYHTAQDWAGRVSIGEI